MGISISGYIYQCDISEPTVCIREYTAEFKHPGEANKAAIQHGWSIIHGRIICPIHRARGAK